MMPAQEISFGGHGEIHQLSMCHDVIRLEFKPRGKSRHTDSRRNLVHELIDLLAVHNLYRRRGIFMCKFGGSGLARDSLGQWG